MSSVADITAELANAQIYLNDPRGSDVTKQGIVDGLLEKIKNLAGLTTGAAVQLVSALQTSQLAEHYKAAIHKAVDDRLQGSFMASKDPEKRQQLLLSMTTYLTPGDYLGLE